MGNCRRITTAAGLGFELCQQGNVWATFAMTLWRFLKQGFRDTSMALASTRSDQDWETHCDSSDSWQNMENMSWCLVNCVFEGCESQSRWWKSVVEAREKGRWSARGLIVKRASHYGHTMNDMTGLSMAIKSSDGKNRLGKLELKRERQSSPILVALGFHDDCYLTEWGFGNPRTSNSKMSKWWLIETSNSKMSNWWLIVMIY